MKRSPVETDHFEDMRHANISIVCNEQKMYYQHVNVTINEEIHYAVSPESRVINQDEH